MNLIHYDVSVDARNDLRGSLRGMADLVDIICSALEERGFTENDYYVEVKGPPEVHLVVSERR